MARNVQTITADLTPAQKAAATKAAKAEAAKAEQLRTARAEVRAKRKADREAAAAHAAGVQPEAQHVGVEQLFDMDDVELPSWKRVTVGLILGLTAAGFVGYGIGQIMVYALAGIATLTTSAALAFTLSALVWVIGIYASWKIGGWVGGKVFGSIVLPEGLASRSAASISNAVGSAKDRVTGVFKGSSTVQRAQAFTGAYTKPKAA